MAFTEADDKFFAEMADEDARQEYLDWLSEQEEAYTVKEAMKAWARSLVGDSK